MRLSILCALVLTTAGLAFAGSASAGVVCEVGGVAEFGGGTDCGASPGLTNEVNQITVSVGGSGEIVFTDASSPVADGDGPGGCTASGNTGTCPGALAYAFDLGAGDDRASVLAVAGSGTSTGGPGADHLQGGPLADDLDGGAGNDVIDGAEGDDVLNGGGDNDQLTGGGGADALHGADGVDSLNGGTGRDALFGGTGDDVESGGDQDDTLEGGSVCAESGGADVLNGDGGNDGFCGGDGADSLNGGDGEDTAYYVRAASVVVTLDNVGGDGTQGEGDNVHSDVEDLVGGTAGDTLGGSDARNVLDGGGGADTLDGRGGDDVLRDSGDDAAGDHLVGGDGDDTLSAAAGPDVYTGGDGEDAVTDYAGRTTPVTVTLDNTAGDGAAGEGDDVQADVEDVTGGLAADSLTGNAADNELDGGPGDDSIAGGDGNDGLHGGAGRDTIEGNAGRDSVDGGSGADTLKTRDGQTDHADCGGGTDSVQGEARDDIAGDCENVSVAPPTAVNINSVQVTRAGFVVVRVTCPGVERSCAGAIIVKTVRRVARRFIKLGQVNYRLRSGQSKIFRAKIAAKDRKALRRARRVKVRAVVTNVNPDTGDSTNATKLARVTTRGLR